MIKTTIQILIALLLSLQIKAQQNLEFVENKGQWHSFIQYQGEIHKGYFALKPDGGYKMLLYNKDDYEKLSELFHPHHHQSDHNPTRPPKSGGGGDGDKKVELMGANTASTSTQKNSSTEFIDLQIRGHVYEVKFLGANANPTAIPDKPLDTYNNYFLGNDKSKWAGNCRIYTAVTYKNIYPNIDVRYYTDNGNLKYDFIIHPGGDASKIVLYVEGASNIKKVNEQLVIKTSVDEVKESIPVSYQTTKKGKQNIECTYNVKGNIVSFNLPSNLQKDATVVIDPQFVFATFTGSRTDQWGYTATYDALGNFYSGGIVFGGGFPVSNGAFQSSFQGGDNSTGEGRTGFDIGILKFNPLGTNRLYATYIGGRGNEYPQSLVVDNDFNCVIAGRTTSIGSYPTTGSNYGAGGNMDIIVTKLNATGTGLIGSKTIGGTGLDGVNINGKQLQPEGAVTTRRNYGDDSRSEVILDNVGNIYLTASVQSTNFPVTNGAFQTVNNGGSNAGRSQDACVIKLSSNLNALLYSTYLGGSGDDAGFVLAINPLNNHLFVAGGTASNNFPTGNAGNIYQSNYQGGDCDGFVAEFANNTPNQMDFVKASYFGTDGNEVLYGIQFDARGFPYIMGTTTGNWPIQNASFSQTGGKQFIAKLRQDIAGFEYSTVFGTNSRFPNISPTAFLVDRCENVYVSGWGGTINTSSGYPNAGTAGLVVTTGAIQPRTDGSDFYFFVLQRNATAQMYGDFYGQSGGQIGDHVDGGTSRFDRNGVIYQAMCANCSGGFFPTTAGVWSPRNGSLGGGGQRGCNLAAIKIAFNLAGVGAQVQSAIKGTVGRISGCVPLTVNFRDTIAAGVRYEWDFGDGSPLRITTSPNTSYVYNAIGIYRVRLVSFDPSSCNGSDTSFTSIKVANNEAVLGLTNQKLAPCDSLIYEFTNTSVAPIAAPFQNNSMRIYFGDGNSQLIGGSQVVKHSYARAGSYLVRLVLLDTNYCNTPDSIVTTLRISSNLKAQFETPSTGCAPYTAIINNTSLGGQTFNWSFPGGTPSSFIGLDPPPISYPNVGTYTIGLRAFDPQTCNLTDTTGFTITVHPTPTSSFSVTPQPPLPNSPITFINNSIGANSYKWQFGDVTILRTIQRDTLVEHLYNSTGVFEACLEATNLQGCVDTSCVFIDALVNPLLDVPSAFTPNGDGINDEVRVRGFGIENLKWRIYNKWGAVVFETTNPMKAWDGRLKGILQPLGVYVYVLEATFTDGKTLSKKGDITLLR